MANAINIQQGSGLKGCFPIGTGTGAGANFISSLSPPIDASGNIEAGYSLQTTSSATSNTGLEWNFTGVGSGIRRYKFPATSTPNPFPSPADVDSDLVLIEREDVVTTGKGIQDLSMPVLGKQGRIPAHNLPSLCDVANQIVFFFDFENAAINVYNIRTKSWKIGWLSAVPTATFTWRAAALLTDDKVNAAYTAPYNAKGIFLSAVTTNWNSLTPGVGVTGIASNFVFVKYTVSGAGEINNWAVADLSDAYPAATGDLCVSAIETVDENAPAYATPAGVGVTQLTAVVAVDTASTFTFDAGLGGTFGWWGYLARNGATKVLLNPDFTVTSGLNLPNWTIRDGATATGYIQTISSDGGYKFFLGGNFDHLQWNGAVVSRLINGFTQIAGVAMIYNYSDAPAPTAANYQYVGTNGTNGVDARNWRGRVIQSNFADDYFYFGGSFVAPPSLYKETQIYGSTSAAFQLVPITSNYSTQIAQAGTTQGLYKIITPDVTSLGGSISALGYQVPLNTITPIETANLSTDAGFCYAVTPLDGNTTQSSYPLQLIGGSLNVPLSYSATSVAVFQTKLKTVPGGWWYSSIEIYTNVAVTVSIRCKLWQSDTSKAQAQFQWLLADQSLAVGLNSLPILGGGNGATAGVLLNSNVVNALGLPLSLITDQFMLCQLEFFTSSALTTPTTVSLGSNALDGDQPFKWVWNLNGYNIADANSQRNFTSFAISDGTATLVTVMTFRILTFSSLNIQIPLYAPQIKLNLVPINQNVASSLCATTNGLLLLLGDGLNASAQIVRDLYGNTLYSGMTLANDSINVITVPKLTGGVVSQPTFSVFGTDRNEVYKIGWANQDRVSFGIYTSFAEYSNLPFTFKTAGTSVNTLPDFGRCVFAAPYTDGLGTTNTLQFNNQDANTSTIDWTKVAVGDQITVQFADGTKNIYRVGSTSILAPYAFQFVVQCSFFQHTPANNDVATFDVTLGNDPEASPYVLKEALGPYLIGNGSDPQLGRDVYLSSYEQSGKAYRYTPDYSPNNLLFVDGIYVGGTTVDNTFLVDTVVFNTNYSSVLLSKSQADTNKWAVVSEQGNIGYSIQNV